MAENGRRKRGDDALAMALARGLTLRDAAISAGVGERTATRRWSEPAFRKRVQELRASTMERAAAKMGDSMTEAADTLRALLKAENEAVRLGAGRSVLELAAKLRESLELEQRLTTLEKQLGVRK
jgi:hypothetical protein